MSQSNIIVMASLRPNEHLAVLLPRSLWKVLFISLSLILAVADNA